MIKIAIADDYQLFRDGLKLLLPHEEKIQVIWTAQNGKQVLVELEKQQPDILLLDIQMPELNGIEVLQELAKKYTHVKVIILSMYIEKIYVEKVFQLGASGYLLKNAGNEELMHAIKMVYEGHKYFAPEITQALMRKTDEVRLTKREHEVLILIAKEMSNPDIAEKLFLSVETVNSHRKNLMRKLDVKNTAGLVKYALQNKLID
ncbi:MAG: response regulator transcription factor [Bacteroidia bacterium]|jgi:DNA-binding NarL/FixJ family response regulator|nr:response regulator transcription factor [Bacteroidia bacterium]